MPTRNVNVSTKENPYGTSEGQDISSVGENMWRRWYRLGKPRATYGELTVSSTTSFSDAIPKEILNPGTNFTANLGHELLIQKISVSSSVDTIVRVAVYTGIFNPYNPTSGTTVSDITQPTVVNYAYIKAGTPWDWYPDGSVSIVRGRVYQKASNDFDMSNEGLIIISAKGASTTGTLYFSVNGVEIARGDL